MNGLIQSPNNSTGDFLGGLRARRQGCMQKFCKGGEGGELGIFYLKIWEGGAAANSLRGSTGRHCLKISLAI